jgi:hypothetical protein
VTPTNVLPAPCPAEAAWIREHVLAPREIPPAYPQCACQGLSNACQYGGHDDCGHDHWAASAETEEETVIGRGHGPFPCKGASGLDRGQATVYLADRLCRARCNCYCHQPPPPPTALPTDTVQGGLW